jgi:hypothetical protein
MSGLVIDAAFPPPGIPAGVSGVMGYIGGAATHVWTPGEWKPFHAVRQYPIWVAEGGAADTQAAAAVKAAKALGWAPDLPLGETRVIVIDMETAVEPAWYKIMAAGILSGGFVPVCYGSLSTVLGNAAADNLVADWNGIKVIPAGQTIHGVQFTDNVLLNNTQVDYCVFDAWLMARGGVGPRKGA